MARSNNSHTRRQRAGKSENVKGSPSRLALVWPRVVLIVVCLAIGGVVLERLSRPKEESPSAKTQVQSEPASRTPVPEGVSASAARLTIQELLEAARQLAARLEETFPQNADALNLAAAIHHELFRDSVKAMDCWERTLRIRPDSAEVQFNVGYAARGLGEYQKASSHFLRAHVLNPGLGDVRYYLADSLLKLGEADRAIAVLEEAGDPDRYGAKGRLVLGHAHSQRGDFEQAREHFEAALALEPSNLQAHHGLIRVMIGLNQPEKAREHRDAVAELDKTSRQAALADRSSEAAQVALNRGFVASRLDVFYQSAAEVYRRNARVNEAEEMLLRAAQLHPDHPYQGPSNE